MCIRDSFYGDRTFGDHRAQQRFGNGVGQLIIEGIEIPVQGVHHDIGDAAGYLVYRECVGPVSYTHLDVYKRQVLQIWSGPVRPEGGRHMELQQIRYILAIAEEKNITKAAEKLFVSQSALSQQLLLSLIHICICSIL